MSDNPIDRALGLRPMEEAKKDYEDVEDAEAEDIKDDEPQEDVSADEQHADSLPATVDDATTEAMLQATLDGDETLKDIEQARSNIQNIIQQGDSSLQEMIELAKQSESPRAFEVAANLMKTLLDANKDFVDMSTRKKYHKEELLAPKEEEQKNNVTNNNLFVGSTTDLLKMLKGEEE